MVRRAKAGDHAAMTMLVSEHFTRVHRLAVHILHNESDARSGLGRYFEFYNAGRPHSSLGGMTPDQFFERAPAESAAA